MFKSSWPSFEQDEIDASSTILKTGKVNYWTGSECSQFEEEFASFIGVKHGIAIANGTLALELALKASDIGPGDEVITTCRTFLASASAIVMCGATPIIADVDLNSQNITLETIKPCISSKTKAIICVHLAGWPCEMEDIISFASKHNIMVIEDCAQAHGAVYKTKKVGSWGHIGAFSFCQDKIMTTGGEGGMVVTNDKRLWSKMWSLKDHGKDHDTVFNKHHNPGFRWLHKSFGSNYRLTEMQAAIGRKQLIKLQKWNNQRRKNATTLKEAFSKLEFIRIPKVPDYIDHAYYKFYVFFESRKAPIGLSRDIFIETLKENGLFCMQGSCFNITHEDAFKQFSKEYKKVLPNAKKLGEESVLFLVDHTINYTPDLVLDIIDKCLSRVVT